MPAAVLPPLLRTNPDFRRFFAGQSVSLLGDQITAIALPLTAVLALHASAGQMGDPDDRLPGPEPAPLAARRRLGRPARRPAGGDARDRRRPRAPDRLGAGRVRDRSPDVDAAVPRRVPDRVAERVLLRRVRRDDPDAGSTRGLRRRRTRSSTAAARSRSSPATASAAYSSSCSAGPYALAARRRSRSSGRRSSSSGCTSRSRRARRTSRAGVTAGARWIRDNAIIRAELLGVATLNFFNFIFFALFVLYATRHLHVSPAALGLVLGAGSVGTLGGSFVTARIGAPDRRRPHLPARLLPVPRPADPRAARGRAALARPRPALRLPSSSPASA